jgi:hypothetical protein
MNSIQLNSANPFPCDLHNAVDKFFQTLAAVQRQRLGKGEIGRAYRDALDDLKAQLKDLRSLAQDGLVDRVIIQINIFMQEYAHHKALYQFLQGAASGWELDRSTPGLEQAIQEKLEQKHQQLSSQLLQILTTALHEREQAMQHKGEQLVRTQVDFVEQSMEREFNRNRVLSEDVHEAHKDARESLKDARESLALAMKHAQLSSETYSQVMGPAVEIAKSANDLIKTNNQYIQQQLPSALEDAQVRANGRKTRARLMWFGTALVVMITLPLLAFLLIQFL